MLIDPGLQRLPPSAAREELERKQREFEAEAEHHRDVEAAYAVRRGRNRIRAAFRRARHALSRHSS